MDELYLENILEHSKNPLNKGVPKRYDFAEEGVNPSCGDSIILYLTFSDAGKVKDVQFDGDGCAISVAATSMLTERIKGIDVKDVEKIASDDIYEMLGVRVAPGREKCALLSFRTLGKIMAKKDT